jgi:hypothetical protein
MLILCYLTFPPLRIVSMRIFKDIWRSLVDSLPIHWRLVYAFGVDALPKLASVWLVTPVIFGLWLGRCPHLVQSRR